MERVRSRIANEDQIALSLYRSQLLSEYDNGTNSKTSSLPKLLKAHTMMSLPFSLPPSPSLSPPLRPSPLSYSPPNYFLSPNCIPSPMLVETRTLKCPALKSRSTFPCCCWLRPVMAPLPRPPWPPYAFGSSSGSSKWAPPLPTFLD